MIPMKKQEVIIAQATPDEIDAAWAYCTKFFEGMKQYRYQQFKPDEILAHLKNGHAALFCTIINGEIKGGCVACVEQSLTGNKSLFIPIMGGVDFNDWYSNLADFLENFAKSAECKTIEYIGRAGFSRLDKSYVEDGRIYVKELDNG